MRYLLFIICITICKIAYCQTGFGIEQISESGINGFQAQYRTVVIEVTSVCGTDTMIKNGCGFILNNKYVATCYHVYKDIEDSSYKPIKIKVYYNINAIHRTEDLLSRSDFTFADLNYTPEPGQYDFRKHIYNGDMESDFIILKLEKIVKAMPPIFDTSKIHIGEELTATGLSYDEKEVNKFLYIDKDFSSSSNTIFKVDSLQKSYLNINTYGFIRHGYSGSPLFTKNGKILGVVQKGILSKDAESVVRYFLASALITKNESDVILKFLVENKKQGAGLGYSININYLISKYMKGYY